MDVLNSAYCKVFLYLYSFPFLPPPFFFFFFPHFQIDTLPPRHLTLSVATQESWDLSSETCSIINREKEALLEHNSLAYFICLSQVKMSYILQVPAVALQ